MVSSFVLMDGVVAALIMLHLLLLISVGLLFERSRASVGVVVAIEIWFSIWRLFGGTVDCILNRWVCVVVVSAAVVRRSWDMVCNF